MNTAESINNKLAYFNELERISSVSMNLFCDILTEVIIYAEHVV